MVDILSLDTIKMNAKASSKQDAIRQAGELLVQSGRVKADYIKGMLAREETMSTYVGNGVSIPHGEFGDLELVERSRERDLRYTLVGEGEVISIS